MGTRNEVVRQAKAAGYTRINTEYGPVKLDDWEPYGATEDDERTVYGGDFVPVSFTFIGGNNPKIKDSIPGTRDWELKR